MNTYLKLSGIFLWILLYSCHQKGTEETKKQAIRYSIKIIDSVLINNIGVLTFLSFNDKKNLYLFLEEETSKIIITDSKGEIKYKFSARGEGDKEFGSILMSAGWYQDTCIVIGSEKGYYFYTFDGYLLSQIPDKVLQGYTSSQKNFHIKVGENEYFLSLRPLASEINQSFSLNKKNYIEKYAPISIFNLKNRQASKGFGYEANSIFKKFDYLYENIDVLFDFNYQNNKLYLLHNPEQKVYVYDASKKFSLTNEIDLKCQYFDEPIKIKFSQSEQYKSIIEIILRNSNFSNLLSKDNILLTTYVQGISEDNFRKFQEGRIPRGELLNYAKKYLQVFENHLKIGDDIIIPQKLSDIAFFKDKNYILFYPNYSQVELEKQNIFYVAKLEEVK